MLAPAREEFWAKYIGAHGAPGPTMLAYCRDAAAGKHEVESIEPSPGVVMSRFDGCQLLVQSPALVDEARIVVERWGATSLPDERDQLDAGYVDQKTAITASWVPFVPLEQIIGTDGHVIAGFDATKAVGKTPLAIRDAVSAPLTLEPDCTIDGCRASGKRPPGGSPVSVGRLRRTPNILVKLETRRELMPRLYELIEASLGEHDGHHVYHRDGVRYVLHEWPGQPVVDIEIAKDQ